MSLYKQLWLAVTLLMVIAFSGSFLLTRMSAQSYLSEQLQLKNIDNANSLALSLSQQADPVLQELLISAQFDNGHYQHITLTAPDNKVMIELINDDQERFAPAWFKALFPIEATPGIAQVSSGWQQTGTLSLESDSRFAYREMWISTQFMLIYFLAGALASGLIGNRILKSILKPLDGVINQAKAIGERRFITVEEPKTREYRLLVSSMNRLSKRVQQMLESEGEDLHKLRLEAEKDPLTGLLNRGPCLQRLNSVLRDDDKQCHGSIVLLRLQRLAEMNRSEGRDVMDTLLRNLGDSLLELAGQYENSIAGRLNGSDFVLLLPGCEETQSTAQKMLDDFLHISTQMQLKDRLVVPAGACLYRPKDSLQMLLTRVDSALALAETEQRSCLKLADINSVLPESCNTDCWHKLILNALENDQGELRATPIVDRDSNALYTQLAPQITTKQGAQICYEELKLWLARLDIAPNMDLWCLQKVLQQLAQTDKQATKPVALSLSAQLLNDEKSSSKLLNLLQTAPDQARLLRLSFPEYGAYQHLDKLQTLSSQLQALGCSVGIDQVGPEIASIGKLAGLGIDYVVVDEDIIRDINGNNTQQIFLRGLCSITHSIGLATYVSGVNNEQELNTVIKLGINGATGAYFRDDNEIG